MSSLSLALSAISSSVQSVLEAVASHTNAGAEASQGPSSAAASAVAIEELTQSVRSSPRKRRRLEEVGASLSQPVRSSRSYRHTAENSARAATEPADKPDIPPSQRKPRPAKSVQPPPAKKLSTKRKQAVIDRAFNDEWKNYPTRAWRVHAIVERRFHVERQQWEYLVEWEGHDAAGKPHLPSWEPAYFVAAADARRAFYATFTDQLPVCFDIPADKLLTNASTAQQMTSWAKKRQKLMAETYLREGLIHLPCGLTAAQLASAIAWLQETFERRKALAREKQGLNEVPQEYVDFKQRGHHRMDVQLSVKELQQRLKLGNGAVPWMPLLKEALDNELERVELVHAGCIVSEPGAEAQKWHSDGPHREAEYDAPSHAVNVFIPLIDLTRANGATEFVVRSFMQDAYNVEKTSPQLRVTPRPAAGHCIIFDYRLKHRGLANTSEQTRYLLYLTYAVPGFRDTYNNSESRYLPALELQQGRRSASKSQPSAPVGKSEQRPDSNGRRKSRRHKLVAA